MSQFFIPKEAVADGRAVLEGEEAHHARDVFRLKAGDEIRLFDGEGRGYRGKITRALKRALEVRILDSYTADAASMPRVTLAQSLLPHDRLEWAIEKAVELGAAAILPVLTQRSTVRLSGDKRRRKKEHWQRIARAACKQCGRLRIPDVDEPLKLADLAARFPDYDHVFLTHTAPGASGLDESLEGARPGSNVMVIVGPEGGFEDAEISTLTAAGARPVSLGDYVLRSETAAVYVLSLFHSRFEQNKA